MINFAIAEPFHPLDETKMYENFAQVKDGKVRFTNGVIMFRADEVDVFGDTLGLKKDAVLYIDVRAWGIAGMYNASLISFDAKNRMFVGQDHNGNVEYMLNLNAVVGDRADQFIFAGKCHTFPDIDEMINSLENPKASLIVTPEVLHDAAELARDVENAVRLDYVGRNLFKVNTVRPRDVYFIGGYGFGMDASLENVGMFKQCERLAGIMGEEYVENMLRELSDVL